MARLSSRAQWTGPVVLALACAALTACGGKSIDKDTMVKRVQDEAQAKHVMPPGSTLDCPEAPKVEVGASVRCFWSYANPASLGVPEGARLGATVKVTSIEGKEARFNAENDQFLTAKDGSHIDPASLHAPSTSAASTETPSTETPSTDAPTSDAAGPSPSDEPTATDDASATEGTSPTDGAGASDGAELDRETVMQEIRTQLGARMPPGSTVDCPEAPKVETGASVRCWWSYADPTKLGLREGTRLGATVTVTGVKDHRAQLHIKNDTFLTGPDGSHIDPSTLESHAPTS